MNNQTRPNVRPSEMSPDLRAKFRYDIRQGMTYDLLRQKYFVSLPAIAEEKRTLGLPVKAYTRKGAKKMTLVENAPKPAGLQRFASSEHYRLAAKRLRDEYAALVRGGYTVTIVDGQVKIEKIETL